MLSVLLVTSQITAFTISAMTIDMLGCVGRFDHLYLSGRPTAVHSQRSPYRCTFSAVPYRLLSIVSGRPTACTFSAVPYRLLSIVSGSLPLVMNYQRRPTAVHVQRSPTARRR